MGIQPKNRNIFFCVESLSFQSFHENPSGEETRLPSSLLAFSSELSEGGVALLILNIASALRLQ